MVHSIVTAQCTFHYRVTDRNKKLSEACWQRNSLIKNESLPLFFSCFSWLCNHGKVNSLLHWPFCRAPAKTLLFHLFEKQPYYHKHHVDCVEAAHVTFSLPFSPLLTLRFVIILHLVVNAVLTPGNSFSFLHSY